MSYHYLHEFRPMNDFYESKAYLLYLLPLFDEASVSWANVSDTNKLSVNCNDLTLLTLSQWQRQCGICYFSLIIWHQMNISLTSVSKWLKGIFFIATLSEVDFFGTASLLILWKLLEFSRKYQLASLLRSPGNYDSA